MVDPRAKGRAAELKARDVLRLSTQLQWERIPASGALDPIHGLKGDLYVPKNENKYCVEVKHYADDHISTKLLTGVSPQFILWWKQALRQAEQVKKKPLLIFKHNRSQWFVATLEWLIDETIPSLHFKDVFYDIHIYQLNEWLKTKTKKDFI